MRASINGTVIAESDDTVIVEGNHYFPPESIKREYFSATDHATVCPWKGTAAYYDITVDGETLSNVAWTYPDPARAFLPLRDHFAFYLPAIDEGFVDDERAQPQPGGFYGGWITSDLAGPFKGEPGSWGW